MLIVDDDRDSRNLLKSLTNRTSARGSSLSGGGWPSTLKGSTKVTPADCIGRFATAEADSIHWLKEGYIFVAVGTDTAILARGADALLARIKEGAA